MMKKLVSMPPIAKVTDIGATAQMSAAAYPGFGERSDSPILMSRKQAIASARALMMGAMMGNASAVPSTAPMRVRIRANNGVVVPSTASPGL
jgi:hypothetical protein